jgi:hypothetical protein
MVVASGTSEVVGGGGGMICGAVAGAADVDGNCSGTTSGSSIDRSDHPITAVRPNTNTPDTPAVAILATCAGGSLRRTGSVIT